MKKIGLAIILAIVVGFLLIQLVPYGRGHTNPPVVSEPTWDTPQTRVLAQRACFDCHSNETTWPWYTNVAPISWLAQRDVEEGRGHLNFSEWGQRRQRVREIGETIQEGSMPPVYYVLLHPQAKLSAQEKGALVSGLAATLGTSGGGSEGQGD